MKRVITAFIMLGAIILYSVSALMLIKNENSRIISKLDEIRSYCEKDDMSSAEQKAAELESIWFSYEKKMSFVVKDDKLHELNTTVAKIRPYCEEANDETEAEIQNVRHQLNLVLNLETPYWYNVL